ncbi:MAG: type II toxin-antitoxin system RelE/ParE family toxin [bacterium]
MKYQLFYTLKSKKDLSGLDKKISIRILNKLDFFVNSGEPLKYAKKLSDHKTGTYRFRVGNYRAIFDIDKKGKITILLILRVKHRKEVYL